MNPESWTSIRLSTSFVISATTPSSSGSKLNDLLTNRIDCAWPGPASLGSPIDRLFTPNGFITQSFGSTQRVTQTPRLTVRCEYTDTDMLPTVVTFGLSPSYGFSTARDAHDWFLRMMREHEEFEVETGRVGELLI